MCIVQRSVGKGTEKLGGGPEGEGKKQQVLQVGLFKGSSSLHPQIPLSPHTELHVGAPGPMPSYSKYM